MLIRPTRTAKRPFATHDIAAIADKAKDRRAPTRYTTKLPTPKPKPTPEKGN